jgi:hypothetical protein
LLLFTPLAPRASYRLEEAMATVVPKQATKVVHTPQALAGRLWKPANDLEGPVIMAASREKPQELPSLDQMQESLRLILILPNTDSPTIAQTPGLRPRYVTHIRSDFQDVSAVLIKMLALPVFQIEGNPSF